jgi:hypothetical protein
MTSDNAHSIQYQVPLSPNDRWTIIRFMDVVSDSLFGAGKGSMCDQKLVSEFFKLFVSVYSALLGYVTIVDPNHTSLQTQLNITHDKGTFSSRHNFNA